MRKLSFIITCLSLLLSSSFTAQSKRHNVFTSDAIDIGYSNGFLSTHFGPKSTGRIKFLVLGTEKHELATYNLKAYNDNAENHGATYYYKCLKVVRDKKYDAKVLFTPRKLNPSSMDYLITLYYYDQMILVDFDRKCPRFAGYYQITEPSFIVLVFLDDDFLVAKRINADSNENIKSIINMEHEIRAGFKKSCYMVNSACD